MAIWVQNVENTGFVPEAPVSDCRQRTVQTAFGLFSTLPCRRQCDHSRGCSSKCELGLSVSRGGGPSPPLPSKTRISYIKTCSNSKPPWGGSEPQVGHQSVPNGPPKLAFCSIWETCIVPNLKNMVCATDVLFTMFLHENAIWNCANTVEICAFGCIPDAAPFFSLHLC